MATLLVVDDDASFREGLAETLADLGHEVVQAATAGAAFDAIAGRAIEAMFLDIRMPDLDGIGALRRLRGMPRGAELPVVVLTAFASSANTIEAMRLGAVDHLTKPVGRADGDRRGLDHRLQPGHAGGAEADRHGGGHRRHRPHHRRDGHRQGAGGACPA